MDKETKCYFSSDISEKISCSKEPKFDSLGFPEVACPEFPCDKVKLLWESHKSLRYEKQIADLQVENDQLKKKLESVKEFVDAMLALHEWNNDKPVKYLRFKVRSRFQRTPWWRPRRWIRRER